MEGKGSLSRRFGQANYSVTAYSYVQMLAVENGEETEDKNVNCTCNIRVYTGHTHLTYCKYRTGEMATRDGGDHSTPPPGVSLRV